MKITRVLGTIVRDIGVEFDHIAKCRFCEQSPFSRALLPLDTIPSFALLGRD